MEFSQTIKFFCGWKAGPGCRIMQTKSKCCNTVILQRRRELMQTCTLAVDIGASSGRHIAGTVQNGKITLQEVYRFENGVHRENGHLCWDIDTLAKEVVNGLKAAHDAGFAPATIGIDTWARAAVCAVM